MGELVAHKLPPQQQEILANGISHGTLSLIPGAGHFSTLENSVAFNAF